MVKTNARSTYMASNGGIHIRRGSSIGDIEMTRDLSQRAHEESWFRRYPYAETKRASFLKLALSNPTAHAFFIAQRGSQSPVGILYCQADEYVLGTEYKVCTIYGVYVDKELRHSIAGGKAAIGLLRACVAWAKINDCREVLVHATSGIEPDRVHRFLKAAGFKVLGANYSLVIAN